MSTIQEDITIYINDTLNTLGETYNTKFKIYAYEEKTVGDNTDEVLQNNSFQTKKEGYIPGVLVDFIGDIVPIQDILSVDYTIPLELRVNTDGDLLSVSDVFDTASLQGFLNTMEDFKFFMKGNYTTINGYNYVFNIDTLTPIGDIDINTEYNYVHFGINIYATISNTFVGNQFTFEIGRVSTPTIDLTSVTPFDREIAKSFNPETHQLLNTNTAVSINNDNVLQATLSLYYENKEILSEIVKQALTSTINQNTIYEVKITYPIYDNSTDSVTKRMIIDGIDISPILGAKTILTITLRETPL